MSFGIAVRLMGPAGRDRRTASPAAGARTASRGGRAGLWKRVPGPGVALGTPPAAPYALRTDAAVAGSRPSRPAGAPHRRTPALRVRRNRGGIAAESRRDYAGRRAVGGRGTRRP
ncbi:hypothetical protein SSP531S_08990 [Streptomyces spongiicola]|uniref:Uncharacterized protein n=1 Tax=Streptomyces spongiicola TaxID=1690221 RepID=A0A388SWX8_9ACTN|nr:hypothetical protein SSP531S_08990 [Streptomyces spongiicola]